MQICEVGREMSSVELITSRIRAGRWEALLSRAGNDTPNIEVWHQETSLNGVEVERSEDQAHWSLSVPIPAELLSDGVQTFLVSDANGGARIGHFTIITGVLLEDDIRAELDLLRAELDLLKRAFRRHCTETSQ